MINDIIRVSNNLNLKKQTAFLAITYVDLVHEKLLSNDAKQKREVLIIAAILIAIKIEEIEIRKVSDIANAFEIGKVKQKDVVHFESLII